MKQTSSGQVVLITLLVLTIATTVALSLISRTTTDTSITNQVEESSQAFSAAEAGIEEALRSGVGTTGVQILTSGTSYNVLVSTIGNAVGIYEFPKKTLKGTTETLWLANHDPSTGELDETQWYNASSIDICTGGDAITVPALAVTLLYRESSDGSYRVVKTGYDPDGARAAVNKFDSISPPGNCGDTGTLYTKTLTFSTLDPSIDPSVDTLIALRLRPLYNDAKIAFNTGAALLPRQGNRIESTGATVGGTNRKIIVYQQYRAPSTVFDAALYSQSSIEQ
jgi:hypothetical protein